MELFIYLLKSMSILAMFYFVYVLALRSETHFENNRHFLLAGILAAIILPFVTFTHINVVAMPTISNEIISGTSATLASQTIIESFNWTGLALVIYVSIMLVLATRLGYQIINLGRVLKTAKKTKSMGYTLVESNTIVAPFSFFKYIVYNPKMHDQQELTMVVKHEQVHAKQKHSVDLLLGNCLTVMQWINPFAWWYKSMMAENLEFIADRETVSNIACEKQYQLALVKNSTNPQNFTITNHFYQSFNHFKFLGMRIKMPFQNGRIKKRIVMLNKSNSNKKSQWKLAIILPLLGMFMWSFNVKEVTEYAKTDASSNAVNYTINSQTTNDELDAIEASFMSREQMKVRFKDRERNVQNQLTTLSIDAAKGPRKALYKYLTLSGKEHGPIGEMVLDVVEGELRISDIENKMVLRATENGLVADDLEVAPQIAKKTNEFFGEDPLYIINEKPWKKEDLPKDKTIVTAGSITALNKEDGQKQYGDAGKDGVFEINGLATFEDPEPAVKAIANNNTTVAAVSKKAAIKDIVIVITKDMSKADLDKKSAEVKKLYGVDITVNDVTYNDEQEIVAIELSYKKGDSQGSYGVHSDDGPIDDIFITIDEDGGMGIGNSQTRINKEKRMAKGSAARTKAMAMRNEEMKVRTEVRKKEMEVRKEEMKVAMKVRQSEMKARSKELKDNQKALAAEKRAMAYSYGKQRRSHGRTGSGESISIKASHTDAQLDLLKEKLEAQGVDFSYRKVKRNSDGLITSIKLSLNNNKGSSSNTSVTTEDGEPIETIVMEY